jgi:hypothetical protein
MVNPLQEAQSSIQAQLNATGQQSTSTWIIQILTLILAKDFHIIIYISFSLIPHMRSESQYQYQSQLLNPMISLSLDQ